MVLSSFKLDRLGFRSYLHVWSLSLLVYLHLWNQNVGRVFRYFCLGQSQNFQKAVTLLIIIKVMSITITRIRIQDDHLSWVVQTHYSDRAGKPTQLNTTVPDLTLYTILDTLYFIHNVHRVNTLLQCILYTLALTKVQIALRQSHTDSLYFCHHHHHPTTAIIIITSGDSPLDSGQPMRPIRKLISLPEFCNNCCCCVIIATLSQLPGNVPSFLSFTEKLFRSIEVMNLAVP